MRARESVCRGTTARRAAQSRRTNQSPAAASISASSPISSGESIGTPEPTVVTAVEWLLSGSGSGVVELAVAVLTRLPWATVTFTTIVTLAEPPTAIVPKSAVTVPLAPTTTPLQVPGLDAQEMKVVPAGRGSVTMTAAAGSGPWLMTVTV